VKEQATDGKQSPFQISHLAGFRHMQIQCANKLCNCWWEEVRTRHLARVARISFQNPPQTHLQLRPAEKQWTRTKVDGIGSSKDAGKHHSWE